MSEKLSENLNLLMAEARLNAEELSRRTGLPASTIKKIRNTKDANPTLSTLEPLAKYFSLTISQFLGDESIPKNRPHGAYQLNSKNLKTLPIISWEDSIHWPQKKSTQFPTVSSEYTYSDTAFALVVEEDDWENLSKGTILLIDPAENIEHRDFAIVYKSGQIKPSLRQILIDEGKIYLKPVMNGYNICDITADHKILGIIIEYKKNLKGHNK